MKAMPTWFKRFLTNYRRQVVVALALGVLAQICSLLLMFTSGYLISETAQPGITLFSILVPVAFVQIFGFGRPLARYLERLVSHNWVLRITSDLRLALFKSIDKRFGDAERSRSAGEYLSLLSDDVAHLQNLYLRVAFPAVVGLLVSLLTAVFFGFFDVPFFLFMLLSLAVIAGLVPFVAYLASKAFTEHAKTLRSRNAASLTDDVLGSTDWVLSGRGNEAASFHRASDAEVRALEASSRRRQRIASFIVEIALGFVAVLILIWASTRFEAPGFDANWIAAFVLGFLPLVELVAALPAALSAIPTHVDSTVRLDEYIAEGSEQTVRQPFSATPEPVITLDKATYCYPERISPALNDIALTIPFGQSVAILGRSGSGKSTLAKTVRGLLVPQQGHVFIGRTALRGGEDLSGAIAYLGQEPYLFNRSLRENLTLGVHERSDGELVDALESVGLATKIASLEEGLDTVVGETGVGFSGGEEHRIAIARLLVSDAPIVLVDEPFAALDPETEEDLLTTLLDSCRNRTLVVITHHLAQIERFDRIIFMENGRVTLDGSPAALKNTSGYFQQLLAFDRA